VLWPAAAFATTVASLPVVAGETVVERVILGVRVERLPFLSHVRFRRIRRRFSRVRLRRIRRRFSRVRFRRFTAGSGGLVPLGRNFRR
jgi:hypothetical protein